MATLITYQFNSTVTSTAAEKFRRRLHLLQPFRMCWSDQLGRCMELPVNMVIADYHDCASAKVVFELEARRDALLTSLETAVYSPIGTDFLLEGLRLCTDSRCFFTDTIGPQVSETEPSSNADDSAENIA